MKKQMGGLIFLLFSLSACGTRVGTEPVMQVQRTQTASPIVVLMPSPRPTSTFDKFNQEARNRGENRFCQVGPDSVWVGSTVNVSVFGMPPNDEVSIYVFPHQESASTFITDGNGYLHAEITIPMKASMEMNYVIVDGTDAILECFVWVWSEEYLPTYFVGLTKTLTPTLSSEQAVVTATQQALKDTLGANCDYGSAQAIRLSPNGQWAEAICGPDSVIVIRIDGEKEWRVSSDSLIGPYTEHFIHVFHWSNDGAYAYISANPHTDGYWEPFHQASALFRLNLETGQTSKVLEGEYYSFSFSPNDRKLAYIVTDQSPVVLNLRDVQTGVEESIQFDSKYNTGGGFLWAADSQRLLFSVTQFNENEREYVSTSIILWDKKQPGTTTLIKDHQEVLVTAEWIDETKILLRALYEDDPRFEFDLISNELKETSS